MTDFHFRQWEDSNSAYHYSVDSWNIADHDVSITRTVLRNISYTRWNAFRQKCTYRHFSSLLIWYEWHNTREILILNHILRWVFFPITHLRDISERYCYLRKQCDMCPDFLSINTYLILHIISSSAVAETVKQSNIHSIVASQKHPVLIDFVVLLLWSNDLRMLTASNSVVKINHRTDYLLDTITYDDDISSKNMLRSSMIRVTIDIHSENILPVIHIFWIFSKTNNTSIIHVDHGIIIDIDN